VVEPSRQYRHFLGPIYFSVIQKLFSADLPVSLPKYFGSMYFYKQARLFDFGDVKSKSDTQILRNLIAC
jgi:hypothetical protein